MPTTSCKDCGSMVSITAEVCPHCGTKYPANNLSKLIIHRKRNLTNGVWKMKLHLDGIIIGELGLDKLTSIELTSGDHRLHVTAGDLSGDTVIAILPSKTYQLEISIPFLSGIRFECRETVI